MLILLSYDSTYYLAVCSWNILRYGLGARCARAPSSMLQVARSERGRHAERFRRQRSGPPLSSIPQHTHTRTRAHAHTQCHAHNDAVIIIYIRAHARTCTTHAKPHTRRGTHAHVCARTRTCARAHAIMRTMMGAGVEDFQPVSFVQPPCVHTNAAPLRAQGQGLRDDRVARMHIILSRIDMHCSRKTLLRAGTCHVYTQVPPGTFCISG